MAACVFGFDVAGADVGAAAADVDAATGVEKEPSTGRPALAVIPNSFFAASMYESSSCGVSFPPLAFGFVAPSGEGDVGIAEVSSLVLAFLVGAAFSA